MSQREEPTRALTLSLIAGILIIGNSALLGSAATWFPWIIPTLPGSSANDSIFLVRLAAVGLTFGVLNTQLYHRRRHIIGSILGIIGGAQTLRHR